VRQGAAFLVRPEGEIFVYRASSRGWFRALNVPLRVPCASVNIGFTLAPGEIDVNRFLARYKKSMATRPISRMPTPVAFMPPKGSCAFGRRRLAEFNVRDAGFDAVDELKDFRGVIRIKGAGESHSGTGIGDVEGPRQHCGTRDYGENRTENLFLRG